MEVDHSFEFCRFIRLVYGDGDLLLPRRFEGDFYQGTNFQELIAAKSLSEFVAAVTTTYQNILATNPAERAAAVAREIAKNRPDVVGLQEVTTLRTGSPQATTVKFDVLQILLGELSKLGPPYAVCATVPGLDQEAPSTLGFNVRITTEDAIIARKHLCKFPVHVEKFKTIPTIPTAVGPIQVRRGWASLDAVIHGQPLRFVTTHLETDFPPIQLAQAKELLQGAGDTLLPVVIAGDFNATADEPADPTFATYKVFIDASTGTFGDAWKQAHPNDPGFTCCQDQNLLNANSKLNHRIDLIVFRGAAGFDDVVLAGDSEAGRTTSGLWQSDHAGLAGTLKRRGEREDQSVVAQNR